MRKRGYLLFIIFFLVSFQQNSTYYNSSEIISQIYLFEKLINQPDCPNDHDFEKLFTPNTEFELSFDLLECVEKNYTPCLESDKCIKIFKDGSKSRFYEFLRSNEGPFFKGTKGHGNIKVYLYCDFVEESVTLDENNASEYPVKAAIVVNNNKYLPATFNMNINKETSEYLGKISNIIINGKSLYKLIEESEKSKSVDINRDCRFPAK